MSYTKRTRTPHTYARHPTAILWERFARACGRRERFCNFHIAAERAHREGVPAVATEIVRQKHGIASNPSAARFLRRLDDEAFRLLEDVSAILFEQRQLARARS